jgi:DNA-directed RNA polymerase subunit N
MIIPIRCFSCGKPIAHKWKEFKQRAREGNEQAGKVLDDLGIKKPCCRAAFLGQEDYLELVNKFKKF